MKKGLSGRISMAIGFMVCGVASVTVFACGPNFNPETRWRKTATAGTFGGSSGYSAVWTGGEMIVAGGHDLDTETFTVSVYRNASDTWLQILNAPEAYRKERFGHTAVWLNGEMLLWGGRRSIAGGQPYENGHVTLKDGWRFKPSNAYDVAREPYSWTMITEQDAPAPRSGHTAVGTADGMIVWGGYSGSDSFDAAGHYVESYQYLNDGGLYDPIAGTWKKLESKYAPSERSGHTAVWTGGQMIVWGGWNGGSCLNDGGIYDNGAWKRISVDSGPQARRAHTAIWTGSVMVVWGGWNGDQFMNDGGIYDPKTDRWTAVEVTGAPSGRGEHTAVWSGKEMIVWGGRDGSGVLATGGRFDPRSNSWKAVTRTLAPAARREHYAFWADKEMIVWGGLGAEGPMTTGARYAPGMKPLIVSLPERIAVPEDDSPPAVAITGRHFGDDAGQLRITRGGIRIPVLVESWRDGYVSFRLPPSVDGIPYDAHCGVIILNDEAELSEGKGVIIDPRVSIFWCESSWRDSCLFPLTCFGITKEIELASAPLPGSYRKNTLDSSGFFDKTSHIAGDDIGGVYLASDPFQADGTNTLHVRVHIGDESIYDISVSFRFYINVPNGLPIDPGWRPNPY